MDPATGDLCIKFDGNVAASLYPFVRFDPLLMFDSDGRVVEVAAPDPWCDEPIVVTEKEAE